MKEKILEALNLAKKFYNEQLDGDYDHNDDDLIRYYALEEDIETCFPHSISYIGWYGAICCLKDLIRFEV